MVRFTTACWLVFCLVAGPGSSIGGVWPENPVLITQAENLVEQLDEGTFDETWEQGSSLFKALHPLPGWLSEQQIVRAAYGDLQSRQLRAVKLRSTYRRSPDGSYAIVQFNSAFAAKAHAVETVVLDCTAQPSCLLREYILQ